MIRIQRGYTLCDGHVGVDEGMSFKRMCDCYKEVELLCYQYERREYDERRM